MKMKKWKEMIYHEFLTNNSVWNWKCIVKKLVSRGRFQLTFQSNIGSIPAIEAIDGLIDWTEHKKQKKIILLLIWIITLKRLEHLFQVFIRKKTRNDRETLARESRTIMRHKSKLIIHKFWKTLVREENDKKNDWK